MACHSALQFVQHNGKFYRDIVGAYPPRANRGLPGGAPGTTKFKARLPDGYSQIFRSYVFGPSGLKDYGSATLRCKI